MVFWLMQLPEDFSLDSALLAGCFNNTSATYKFYWLLAILKEAEQGHERIDKMSLFAQMIANAWYTVNYSKVSFGASDNLQEAIEVLRELENIPVDAKPEHVHKVLTTSKNPVTQRELRHFDRNVPHKFLSPWLGSGSKSNVYALSQHGSEDPPYALYDDFILLQPSWVEYFKRYAGLLRGFCYWHLTLFLQARNPNVPDVPNKLIRPEKRGSLSDHKRKFWDIVIGEMGGVECIYTGKRLHVGDYAVEHFVPHAFVAHDQMWNLIPADPSFNSSKSDKLPPLDRYFDPFFGLQHTAVEIIRAAQPKNKFLEDYVQVFKSTSIEKDAFRDTLVPLITIAANNGFQYMRPPENLRA
jgi:hypothetical protein